jgi:recombinational DNA repair protein (RecF pathway)
MEKTCCICQKSFEDNEIYEYRGAFACEPHVEQMESKRDHERNAIISEENAKTKVFKGLDLGRGIIGKANRELLSPHIEIASKESVRLKNYERPSGEAK